MACPRVRNLRDQDWSCYAFNELALKGTNVCFILVAIQTIPDWCGRGLPRAQISGGQGHRESHWKLATASVISWMWPLHHYFPRSLASSTATGLTGHMLASPAWGLITLLVNPVDRSLNDAMQYMRSNEHCPFHCIRSPADTNIATPPLVYDMTVQ